MTYDPTELPEYSDNQDAVDDDANAWFNTGTGTDPAGIYFYDGGVIGPLEAGSGSAPAQLSGLGIDTTKDWGGFSIEGLGGTEQDYQTIPPTEVTPSNSPYTTQNESRIAADTTNGEVTITLASSDAVDGRTVKIVDAGGNAASDSITVEVEGSDGEVINPGGATSKQIDISGGYIELENVAGDWYSDLNAEKETIAADTSLLGDARSVHFEVDPETQDADIEVNPDPGYDGALIFREDGTDKWSFFYRESNGAFEYYNYEAGETALKVDPSNSEITLPDNDLTVNGSIRTGDLSIGGRSYLNHVTNKSASNGSTLDLSSFNSLTSPNSKRELVILLRWFDGGTQQDLNLRFNSDGSTGLYRYVNESGTEQTSADEIVLLSESQPFVGGWFTITISRFSSAILSVDRAMTREDRADAIAQRGSRTISEDINSIQMIPGAGTDAKLDARLFERKIK